MKIKDIRALETKKLHEKLSEVRAKLTKVRFSVSNKEAKNVREMRKHKRDIAQYLTILNEREAGINTVPEAIKEEKK